MKKDIKNFKTMNCEGCQCLNCCECSSPNCEICYRAEYASENDDDMYYLGNGAKNCNLD